MTTSAWGYGLATVTTDGTVLDVWFPHPRLGTRPAQDEAPGDLVDLTGSDHARRVRREIRLVEIADLDAAPVDTPDVWLRLHLLSHRLVKPHGLNLEGVFGLLTNVVWTSHGPCAVEDFESTRARMRMHGQHVTVFGIDKFPRLVDYVVPSGVRIADADDRPLPTGEIGEILHGLERLREPQRIGPLHVEPLLPGKVREHLLEVLTQLLGLPLQIHVAE